MKKMISSFRSAVLSREQMKKVKGGAQDESEGAGCSSSCTKNEDCGSCTCNKTVEQCGTW